MSRIGKMPITVPAGVEITIAEGNVVTVKGPKGTLTRAFHPNMKITVDGAVATVARPNDEKANKSAAACSFHSLPMGIPGRWHADSVYALWCQAAGHCIVCRRLL